MHFYNTTMLIHRILKHSVGVQLADQHFGIGQNLQIDEDDHSANDRLIVQLLNELGKVRTLKSLTLTEVPTGCRSLPITSSPSLLPSWPPVATTTCCRLTALAEDASYLLQRTIQLPSTWSVVFVRVWVLCNHAGPATNRGTMCWHWVISPDHRQPLETATTPSQSNFSSVVSERTVSNRSNDL